MRIIQKYGVDIFTCDQIYRNILIICTILQGCIFGKRTPNISSTMLRGNAYKNYIKQVLVGTGRIAGRFVSEARYVSIVVSDTYNPEIESVKSV